LLSVASLPNERERIFICGSPNDRSDTACGRSAFRNAFRIFRIILHTTNLDLPKALILQFLVTDLFFVPCFAYDLLARHRIHPAYLYALVLIILEQTAQPNVISWTPWINLAYAIQSFLA